MTGNWAFIGLLGLVGGLVFQLQGAPVVEPTSSTMEPDSSEFTTTFEPTASTLSTPANTTEQSSTSDESSSSSTFNAQESSVSGVETEPTTSSASSSPEDDSSTSPANSSPITSSASSSPSDESSFTAETEPSSSEPVSESSSQPEATALSDRPEESVSSTQEDVSLTTSQTDTMASASASETEGLAFSTQMDETASSASQAEMTASSLQPDETLSTSQPEEESASSRPSEETASSSQAEESASSISPDSTMENESPSQATGESEGSTLEPEQSSVSSVEPEEVTTRSSGPEESSTSPSQSEEESSSITEEPISSATVAEGDEGSNSPGTSATPSTCIPPSIDLNKPAADCADLPSLIEVKPDNTTILINALLQWYTCQNASVRLGANTLLNQIRHAVYNRTASVEAKFQAILISINNYQRNNFNRHQELLNITISEWNGNIGELVECIEEFQFTTPSTEQPTQTSQGASTPDNGCGVTTSSLNPSTPMANCTELPEVIAIQADNTTSLTDALSGWFNCQSTSTKMGASTTINNIKNAIWDPTTSVSQKLESIGSSLNNYNRNNKALQQVLLNATIPDWNDGSFGQFANCTAQF